MPGGNSKQLYDRSFETTEYALIFVTGYGKSLEPKEWGRCYPDDNWDAGYAEEWVTDLFEHFGDGSTRLELWQTGYKEDRSGWVRCKFATLCDETMGRLVDDAAGARFRALTYLEDHMWEEYKAKRNIVLAELNRTVPFTE